MLDRMTSIVRTPARLAGTLVLAALAGLTIAACEGGSLGEVSGPGADTSDPTLTVRMTDAPGDLEMAWIRVTEVRLSGETDSDAPGGVTFQVENPDELIPLTPDAVTDLVKDRPIEPGVYGQLRLVIDGGVAESTDGRVWTFGGAEHPEGKESDGRLKCPSCTETGVKVNLPEGGLDIDNRSVILMLDFNVSESFGHTAGRSGMFIMRPTITSSTVETSGDIEGSVVVGDGVSLPDCGGSARTVEDFTPKAVLSSDSETSQTAEVTATNEAGTEGTYEMDFLEPGDWDMTFVAEKEFEVDGGTETLTFEATVDPDQVTVESGAAKTADYTITGADCTSSSDGGGSGGGSGA